MAAAKKRGLGRGLDALLGQAGRPAAPSETESREAGLHALPIGALQPGRYQPRTGMDPERLAELADSIRAQGLIQPIVVRALAAPKSGNATHEIIAGERRWRAAQIAGLAEVPVVLREADDLLDGLALHVQRDQQCGDLGVGGFAAQDFGHDFTSLVAGERGAVVGDLMQRVEDHGRSNQQRANSK